MDHVTRFIVEHGYWAVLAGCLMEGETVLVLAGYAARRGLLDLPLVMAIAAAAGAFSDTVLFALGRWRGARLLDRWPRIGGHRARLERGVARWGSWMVVGVRFMYGMRLAGPVLLGTTALTWRRFIAFNLLGAVIWAALVAGAGWVFGSAAEALLARVEHAQRWLIAALAAGAGVWLAHRWWRRRQQRRAPR